MIFMSVGTCTIPSGAMIMLDFHHLHLSDEIWGPNAREFNPENFTPEKIAQRHPYSFLPFSGGPRNCVGKTWLKMITETSITYYGLLWILGIKYAWIAMKIMLASMLRRYRFTTELKFEEISTKWDITLKLVGGHMIKLEKREFNTQI